MAPNAMSHYFHAEAHALAGKLRLPFEEHIKKQAFVKLEGNLDDLPVEERAQRNYFSQHSKNFRLEGIVSYAAAHTQVSGHQSEKHDGASVTLATSVVEDLNVLNVVTADRVVAQISTTHIPGQYSPHVTFLGTQFENLRIARHRADPYLKLDMAGARVEGKDALPFKQGSDLWNSIVAQYGTLKAKIKSLAKEELDEKRLKEAADALLGENYHGLELNHDEILSQALAAKSKDEDPEGAKQQAARQNDPKQKKDETWGGINCSLVENIEIDTISAKKADGEAVQIEPPATTFGHVIDIPDFGKVFLAELTVKHNSYHLTMIRLEMGCLAAGSAGVASANVNGKGSGGH
jgi:hypothetical protein